VPIVTWKSLAQRRVRATPAALPRGPRRAKAGGRRAVNATSALPPSWKARATSSPSCAAQVRKIPPRLQPAVHYAASASQDAPDARVAHLIKDRDAEAPLPTCIRSAS